MRQAFNVDPKDVGKVLALVNDGTAVRRVDVSFPRDVVRGLDVGHFELVGVNRFVPSPFGGYVSVSEGTFDQLFPTASTNAEATQSTILGSVRANRIAIVISIASLAALIDEKLTSLHNERPNARAAQGARDKAIAHYERLKRDLESLRDVAVQLEHAKAEEKTVEKAATTFMRGVRSWWAKEHEKICDKGYDAAIFASCVGVCSLLGAGGAIAVAVSGALVGGKTVVQALKSLPKKLPT